MSNCITIVLKSELRQFDNYLDVFSIISKNIKSFDKNEIENFLKKTTISTRLLNTHILNKL